MESQQRFAVVALSPDDSVKISQLTDLFERASGDCYPVQRVYDNAFWSGQIDHRLTSLAVFLNELLVAHIAIKPDRTDPSQVQLVLPITDLKELSDIREAAALLADVLKRQCRRQRWRMIYHYALGCCPLSSALVTELMGSLETAICPAYLALPQQQARAHANLDEKKRSSNVIITQVIPFPAHFPHLDLYVPEMHREFCRWLYAPLGLERTFRSPARLAAAALADRSATEVREFPLLGTTHVEVFPSFVGDTRQMLSSVERHKERELYLFVDATDPKCSEICEELEFSSFRFCGMLPLRKSRDSIVYWREHDVPIDTGHLSSARATVLAEYIQNYQRNGASKFIPAKTLASDYGQVAARR